MFGDLMLRMSKNNGCGHQNLVEFPTGSMASMGRVDCIAQAQ